MGKSYRNNGTQDASGSYYNTVQLWDVVTGAACAPVPAMAQEHTRHGERQPSAMRPVLIRIRRPTVTSATTDLPAIVPPAPDGPDHPSPGGLYDLSPPDGLDEF